MSSDDSSTSTSTSSTSSISSDSTSTSAPASTPTPEINIQCHSPNTILASDKPTGFDTSTTLQCGFNWPFEVPFSALEGTCCIPDTVDTYNHGCFYYCQVNPENATTQSLSDFHDCAYDVVHAHMAPGFAPGFATVCNDDPMLRVSPGSWAARAEPGIMGMLALAFCVVAFYA